MKKRTTIVATTGMTAALAVALTGSAWAFWDAGSTGAQGYTTVDALGTPEAKASVAVNRRAVTFTVTTPTGGPAPKGYRVDRPGGLPACTVSGAATSCTYATGTTTRVESGDYKVYALLGNTWASPVPAVVAIDTVDPTVLSFVAAPGQPNPSPGNDYDFVATFSEPVTGFLADDVTFLSPAGVTPTPVITVTADSADSADSATVYRIHVAGVTLDGDVKIRIPLAVALDLAGNPNAALSSATVRRKTPPLAPSAAQVAPAPEAPATSDHPAPTSPAEPDPTGPAKAVDRNPTPPAAAAPAEAAHTEPAPVEAAPQKESATASAPAPEAAVG